MFKTILQYILKTLSDYQGQPSYGRAGGLLCLLFAMGMSVSGFYFKSDITILSYCSSIALQFLAAAVSLYLPSKAAEAYSKKWAPQISSAVSAAVGAQPQLPAEVSVDDSGSAKATND